MKTPELVALPHIEPERDGVQFNLMAFPQGFDEERIIINACRIKQINRIAGLDGVTVVGSIGPKSEESIGVGSFSSDGSATAGISLFKKRRDFVNGVYLHTTRAAKTDAQGIPQDFYYTPVTIAANLTARDETLAENSNLLDVHGHAQFIAKTLSEGLTVAAKRKARLTTAHKLIFAELATVGGFAAAMTHNPAYFAGTMALWYGADIGFGLLESKRHGLPIADKQFSLAAGMDRSFIAQFMARTAPLATVAS